MQVERHNSDVYMRFENIFVTTLLVLGSLMIKCYLKYSYLCQVPQTLHNKILKPVYFLKISQ